MNREPTKQKLLSVIGKTVAGLLLLSISSSPVLANYISDCSANNIENSYTQKGTEKFDLKTLQQRLQKGEYFSGELGGKWNSKTSKALSVFCKELGKKGESIPKQERHKYSLELFSTLYDKAQEIKPYQVCDIETIKTSFDALPPEAKPIRKLQELLRTDGFLKTDPSGTTDEATIDEATLKGLEEFCLKVVSKDKAMPRETVDAPTGKLAEFLEEKLSGYKPESGDCAIGKIEQSFAKLGLDQDSVTALRQELVKRGFLEADDAGKKSNNKEPPTLNGKEVEALRKFCLDESLEDPSIPHENTEAVTNELAAYLDKKLLDTKEKPEDPEKPVDPDDPEKPEDPEKPDDKKESADCELESVAAEFNHLGTVRTREIQQFLKASGFLTDWADGLAGPETYGAISRMCEFFESTAQADDTGNKQAVIDDWKSLLKGGHFDRLDHRLQQRGGEISLVATNSLADPPVVDCGCSRDFEANVYGFLPFWLADGSDYGADFSMLDRVGVFGLQLDPLVSDSKPQTRSFWHADDGAGSHIARFINTAHRHRVKVDITFYSSDWRDWNVTDKKVMTRIVDAIETVYRLKFSDTSDDDEVDANLLSLLRKIMPFMERDSDVGVDGINLYFDNFNRSADASKIVAMVEAVKARMPEVRLNLMLDPDWSGIKRAETEGRAIQLRGIDKKLFSGLEEILGEDSRVLGDKSRVANLLVFLPRNTLHAETNTSHAKKLLRRSIEDAFDHKAEIRRNVLRKTIPVVVTFDDKSQSASAAKDQLANGYGDQSFDYFRETGGISQFGDDLIYMQDNFDGVGLWPLPLVAAPPQDPAMKSPEAGGQTGGTDSEPDPQMADENDSADQKPAQPPNGGVAIARLLVDKYEIKPDWLKEGQWEEIGNLAEMVCQFACPNRWLFRLAFDALVLVLVIYGLLATVNCRLREIYRKNSLYFAGYGFVTVIVACTSLICDPFWQEYSEAVLIAVVLALAAYPILRKFNQSRQAKYP